MTQQQQSSVVSLVLAGVGVLSLLFWGTPTMQRIEDQVARDAVTQYQMVLKNDGTALDRCVAAGFVSAAYLQAQNQAKYNEWKATERRDCRAAGLPEF